MTSIIILADGNEVKAGDREGKIVVVDVASPQQIRKLAIIYMTHPIHSSGAVCFHPGGVRRQCPAYDGASTSIGAARPQQSTLSSGRCRAKELMGRRPRFPQFMKTCLQRRT